MSTKSKIDDDELDQMIANLQKEQSEVPGGLPGNSDAATDQSAAPIPQIIPQPGPPLPPAPLQDDQSATDSDDAETPDNTSSGPMPAPAPLSPIPENAISTSQNGGTPPMPAPQAQPVQPIQSLQPPQPVQPLAPNLDSIKLEALSELRPLVDKLNLPADEKFDTLLLMIRSTDDVSLIPLASAVARQINDDTRRAKALLDVIKEIDFFKQNS